MGPSSVSIAARVAGKMRWPNASPQPVTPASVSTRTSSMSMLVRARPPSIGVASAITIGRLRTIVATPVIFMASHYAPDRSILWPVGRGLVPRRNCTPAGDKPPPYANREETRNGPGDRARTYRDLRARPVPHGRLLSRPQGHAGHQAELAGRHRVPQLGPGERGPRDRPDAGPAFGRRSASDPADLAARG